MVRRVGFGDTPTPEKERKTKPSPPHAPAAPRPDPTPVQDKGISIRATQLSRNEVMFKIAKIVVAVVIAIQIETGFVFLILLMWAAKETWSLLSKVSDAAETEE